MAYGLLKGKKIKYAIVCALATFFLIIILAGVGIYYFEWRSKPINYISCVIPYPVILVNWEPIPFCVYVDDLRALEKYWDFQSNNQNIRIGIQNNDEIRKNLVNKLINEKIVSIFAKKEGIKVSEEEKYLEWDKLNQNFEESQEVSDFIAQAYGWDQEKFIGRVLEPFLLQEKVKEYLLDKLRNKDEQLLKKAQEIYFFASKEDADFSRLAEKYSEDSSTAKRGGDLGYFSRGTMDPYFEEAVYSMEPGEISEPIKSSYGYHIIKLEDLLYNEEGIATQARARHILIKGFDFDEWLQKQRQEIAIYRLVR